MKALYVIVVLLLNATTGEVEDEQVSNVPMSLEDCTKTLVERGPVPVTDGVAIVAGCRKLEAKVTT